MTRRRSRDLGESSRDNVRFVGQFVVSPRAGRRPVPPACQKLTVQVREMDLLQNVKLFVNALDANGRYVGRLEAMTDGTKGRSTRLDVIWSSLLDGGTTIYGDIGTDRDLSGCGIGTRLYEAAAAYACQQGLRMESDTSLSERSRAFWQKQVAKGRAYYSRDTETYVLRDVCRNSRDLSGIKHGRRKSTSRDRRKSWRS